MEDLTASLKVAVETVASFFAGRINNCPFRVSSTVSDFLSSSPIGVLTMSNAGIVAMLFIYNNSVYGAEVSLRNDAFLDRALQIGLDSNESSLWSGVRDNSVRAVQSALDSGLNPSSVVIVPCKGSKKYFADNDIHGLPNQKDVDSNIVSYDGPVSILMYAVVRSVPEVVSILVSGGADVNFVGVGRQTAFQFMLDLRRAFRRDEQEICLRIAKSLMRGGANVNRVDDHGNTILLSAADNHQTDIVKMLIESGADVNWSGRNNVTPLIHAVSNQDSKLAEYLIEHGADIEAKNSQGHTAMTIAAVGGYTECLKLLLDRGANAGAVDNGGNTALDLMQQCDWSNWDTSYCRNWESERIIQEMLYKSGGRYKTNSYLNDSLERKFNPISQPKAPGGIWHTSRQAKRLPFWVTMKSQTQTAYLRLVAQHIRALSPLRLQN